MTSTIINYVGVVLLFSRQIDFVKYLMKQFIITTKGTLTNQQNIELQTTNNFIVIYIMNKPWSGKVWLSPLQPLQFIQSYITTETTFTQVIKILFF